MANIKDLRIISIITINAERINLLECIPIPCPRANKQMFGRNVQIQIGGTKDVI